MFSCLKKKPFATPTGFSLALHLAVSLLTLLALVTTAAADTYVVSNDSEVPVRSGQGTEYKILSLLKNGDTVTSLEEDGYWIRVRTTTGREGWMLKRYLSSSAPAIDDAFSLPINSNLTNKQTEATNTAGEQKSNTIQPEVNVLPEMTEHLQQENTLLLLAEQKLKETNKELEELRNKLALVTLENKELQKDERIKWFLAGGGVLVIGWIIGMISSRSRKRKPSLL